MTMMIKPVDYRSRIILKRRAEKDRKISLGLCIAQGCSSKSNKETKKCDYHARKK